MKNYKPGQIVTIKGKQYRIKKTSSELCKSRSSGQTCEFYGSPKNKMPCLFCIRLYRMGIKKIQMKSLNAPNDNAWWVALGGIITLIIVSLFIPTCCNAQSLDTLDISGSQIIRIVEKQSASKKSTTYYVVYSLNGQTDVTTTSKSTIDYITLCKECNVEPKLGLKVKDGQITSIVRKKTKIKQKKP